MGKHSKQSDSSQWKKKGRRGWTTELQEEFLTSHIPSYLAEKSGSSRIRLDFWPPLWEQFFERWPLELKSDKEKEENKVDRERLGKAKMVSILSIYNAHVTHATTQQIKDWYGNHTRESCMVARRKVLDLTTKKTKKLLPEWQAYSHLFYDVKIKDVVMEEWPAERACLLEQKVNGEEIKEAPKEAPLWFRNKLVQAEFKIETDEVRKEVEEYRQVRFLGNIPSENSGDAEKAKRVAIAAACAK
jgi:hypothetical protein